VFDEEWQIGSKRLPSALIRFDFDGEIDDSIVEGVHFGIVVGLWPVGAEDCNFRHTILLLLMNSLRIVTHRDAWFNALHPADVEMLSLYEPSAHVHAVIRQPAPLLCRTSVHVAPFWLVGLPFCL